MMETNNLHEAPLCSTAGAESHQQAVVANKDGVADSELPMNQPLNISESNNEIRSAVDYAIAKKELGLSSDHGGESTPGALYIGDENDSSESSSIDEDAQHQQQQQQQQEEHEKRLAQSMALNTAFESLENMRKANLEVEYGGRAVGSDMTQFHQFCTVCLKEQKDKEEAYLEKHKNTERRKWRKAVVTRYIAPNKKSPPCLICACPVCPKHGCRDFKKEGLSICGHCAPLFTMDFVVDTISNDSEEHRRQCLAHMIDSYDRALLMLQYSSQFIEEIATALERNSRKNDQVGLGSSGVGLMSGFTGVAAVAAHFVAAATILSPAGPPLLIASILFGSTAAAASTSSEAINYYSEPNQLANKILALHELVNSLLAVTAVMKGALQRGHIDAQQYIAIKNGRSRRIKFQSSASSGSLEDDTTASTMEDAPDTSEGGVSSEKDANSSELFMDEMSSESDNNRAFSKDTTAAINSKPSSTSDMVVVKKKAPSNTRVAVSRATTNAMKVMQAASIACVALSAATIVMEAKNMNDTLESLRAGSPCEKADQLRQIKKEIDRLPSTNDISEECDSYLKATNNKQNLY